MEHNKIQKLVKRLVDIVVSLIMLLLFLPIWMIVAIFIKITSPGQVFFLQERPGINQGIFKVIKFRTMKPGSDKMAKGQEVFLEDNRITKFGKFLRRSKMDEIPQVINVLKGEMSLVGPRPERVESLGDYTEEIAKRLHMTPGMTGLAQVSGNINLSLENRYQLDVYYVEHFSLFLDLKIIIRTFGVILFGEVRYINKCLININVTETAATKEEIILNEKNIYNRG